MAGLGLLDEQGHGVPGREVFDFVVSQGGVAYGPVHVIEVEVGQLQVGKGDVDAFFDVFATMAEMVLEFWTRERI